MRAQRRVLLTGLNNHINSEYSSEHDMTAIITQRPANAPSECLTLPLDIANRIASYLLDDHAHATLAALQRCSKEYYLALSPVTYRRVDFRSVETCDLFRLGEGSKAEQVTPKKVDDAVASGAFFSLKASSFRRMVALGHIKHLTIHSLPACTSPLSKSFSSVARSSDALLLPGLESVALGAKVADEIRTYIPETYDRPHSPLFLEALIHTSRPSSLCLAHRVVPSVEWDEHLEMTSIKQYQLVARVNQFIEDGWASLKVFEVHDVVHQVLPSLKGCRNVYHFASHCVGPPEAPRFIAPGLASTFTPGPKWNFRSWQIGTAIKNLFPSGISPAAVLQNTSWEFVNHEGHILTKPENDDDDDTGVGYLEVGRLIGDALKTGLPMELAGRDGFKGELAMEVLERMSFERGEKACESCQREYVSGLTAQ
ncbi:hypothetical protein L198_07657 [Cryptococcus wingfieldii CBS 7118]|uniref:Uncharacterized protein n=1 Tax=Cryptococcus wingfieldii CBS 7118 TaxID=1295528 RepID=A0A1E3I627_9TREE|nr:hypothetical protein L198_07657 [Cryptococcus wingfieldii CBS 7118]ODN83958.1 hypothetical protein L198_07657 [Cryptococcus wingfieldii CBS 7118]